MQKYIFINKNECKNMYIKIILTNFASNWSRSEIVSNSINSGKRRVD